MGGAPKAEDVGFLLANGLHWIHYLGAFLIGGFVGATELIQRFKSEKVMDIVTTVSGLVYILINGLASLLALGLIAYYKLNLGMSHPDPITLMLMAGGSAMLVLRSSFFTVKSGNNKDYSVGLGLIVNVLIERADRAFDQDQAIRRAPEIASIMAGKDYLKASVNLTARCLALMSLAPEEVKALQSQIREINSMEDADNQTRSFALGCLLAAYTGIDLLKEAVKGLGDSLDFIGPKDGAERGSSKLTGVLARIREQGGETNGGRGDEQ